MLLTWIAELADEPLALEPADRPVEWETNTWHLNAEVEDRRSLTVAEVAAAFERTAAALRARVLAAGYTGPATFYVWHDELAGQLRCSTGTAPPDDLPFGGAYAPTTDLAPVVAPFLADSSPGVITITEPSEDDAAGPDPEPAPFPVWVRAVGA
ncbi:hypothetical protein GCM10020229_11170 [Kitasatospora albolonga]|uniref:hypothetical protein n=1 Tax=Kitasatospora albolonga TaxID=68173 RepID=UPI0031ED6513